MKIIKTNKGVAMTDVALALSILVILSGVVASLFHQIAYNNVALRMNTVASYYAIKISEYIDEIPYEDVTDELSDNIIQRLNEKYPYEQILSDTYDIDIQVEKYSDENVEKQDIIKKIKIIIRYNILDDEKVYEIDKLKIKEI